MAKKKNRAHNRGNSSKPKTELDWAIALQGMPKDELISLIAKLPDGRQRWGAKIALHRRPAAPAIHPRGPTTREWAKKFYHESTECVMSIIKSEPNSPKRRGAQATLAKRTLRTKPRVNSYTPVTPDSICLLTDEQICDNSVFDLVIELANLSRSQLIHIAHSALSAVVREIASQNLSVCNNLVKPENAPERRSHTPRRKSHAILASRSQVLERQFIQSGADRRSGK